MKDRRERIRHATAYLLPVLPSRGIALMSVLPCSTAIYIHFEHSAVCISALPFRLNVGILLRLLQCFRRFQPCRFCCIKRFLCFALRGEDFF